MFSISPSTGVFSFWNMSSALRASSSATSCGVRHDDGPGQVRALAQRQLDVPRAGRQVDDQHIQLAPVHLRQQLLQAPP